MTTLIYILIAVGLVSLVSLIGVLYFFFNERLLLKLMPFLVAFAAGGLLGGSFFHLIPESFEAFGDSSASIYIIAGIILFLLFEQTLHWHHAHGTNCEDCQHDVTGYSILLGDGLHNFLDGILIASAFMVNVPTGIALTIAILLHEIPQELGDFAILIKSGFSRGRALLWNLISALMAVLGGIGAFFFLGTFEGVLPYIIAIGAGGFLYIALVDLFAELKASKNWQIKFGEIIALLLGLALIFFSTG